ncbi:transmembrane protease serine 9-like [Argopecten irradians]|uniref:transmembrane protease serine 9-like n=1 Tax=Argopecten irradians TaxID=31199 RepID=UPI003721A05F
MRALIVLGLAALAYAKPGGRMQGINRSGCGTQAYSPLSTYIVGGTEATPNSWPWMALLEYNGFHMCGGSLITDRLVATAAHCVDGVLGVASKWTVRLGVHDKTTTGSTEQRVSVRAIKSHPSYNNNDLNNDIAILVLARPVTLNNYVNTVCITEEDVPAGTNCVATGWGDTQGTGPSNVLRQVTVPIISQQTCASSQYYGSYMNTVTMICAGYPQGGKDSCQGDSGGPLVCPTASNTWALTGITSWGFGCAEAYKPGVYTRVYNYLQRLSNNLCSDLSSLTHLPRTTMRAFIVLGLVALTFAKPGGRKPNGGTTSLQSINRSGCGTQAYLPSSTYIVGGSEATPNSWPWMALLEYNGYHVCGGSLISDRHVLTAAHCVEGSMAVASKWTVRLGVHDKTTTGSTEQSVSVRTITSHRRYSSSNINNDIAIMELASPVTLNDYVTPVCITDTDVPAATNCVSTGWGDTQGTGSSNVLRQVTVPIISQQTCSSSQYYGSYLNTKTMICAGYPQGGKDSCQGDSGGPLVCPTSSNTWALTGVTSWGFGCADAYKPGVYTRVYNYQSWITNNL